ncbi:unnamed protein product [Echinostoma caproni]|uniref:C-type lectin domain-containing protein n=1 Tax=Echinostoma caproni TaxID=27848 RepID=A0A183APQ1_9TREM|nr:unnamed protein product [Echinostoma caproni]
MQRIIAILHLLYLCLTIRTQSTTTPVPSNSSVSPSTESNGTGTTETTTQSTRQPLSVLYPINSSTPLTGIGQRNQSTQLRHLITVRYKRLNYVMPQNLTLPFDEAELHCRREFGDDMHLVSVHSGEEWAMIEKVFGQFTSSGLWLGGTMTKARLRKFHFEWKDFTPFDYHRFTMGERKRWRTIAKYSHNGCIQANVGCSEQSNWYVDSTPCLEMRDFICKQSVPLDVDSFSSAGLSMKSALSALLTYLPWLSAQTYMPTNAWSALSAWPNLASFYRGDNSYLYTGNSRSVTPKTNTTKPAEPKSKKNERENAFNQTGSTTAVPVVTGVSNTTTTRTTTPPTTKTTTTTSVTTKNTTVSTKSARKQRKRKK